MNSKQLELLNEIKVKMFYDPSKTLSEQTIPGAGPVDAQSFYKKEPISKVNQDFEQFKIYPIEGYKAYLTPAINDPQGGVNYIYLPYDSENSIEKYSSDITWDTFKDGKKIAQNFGLDNKNLQKVLTPGTVRKFKIKGEPYAGVLNYDDSTGLTFKGYRNKAGQYYKTPNPEDFKSEFEKFMDKWGVTFQIVGSIVVSALIEKFTFGLGTPLALRILAQIGTELAFNIPFAVYEIQKGDDMETALGLAVVFSLLPLVEFSPLIRGIKGASKEVLASIAKKATDAGNDVKKFGDSLSETEKYVFSQVMKQDPEKFKEAFEAGLKDLFTKAIQDKTILKKIALIDQKWWKSAGLQLSGAILILLGVSIFGPESFSDAEKTRMMNFMKDVEAKLTPEQTQKLTLELINNPELAEPLIEVAKTDSLQVIEANQKKLYEAIQGNIEFSEAVKLKVQSKVNELKQKKSGKTPE
jgi:hypothetical protein